MQTIERFSICMAFPALDLDGPLFSLRGICISPYHL
jgi:hypothetical protein